MAAKEQNPLQPPGGRPAPPPPPPPASRAARPRLSYDQRCEALARFFLNDAGIYDHAEERELAQAIQDAVEAHFSMRNA